MRCRRTDRDVAQVTVWRHDLKETDMHRIAPITLAASLALTVAACKKDEKPSSSSPSATPAAGSQASTGTTPPPAEPAPNAPATDAPGDKTADAHKGHRHEPSDPYYCPMHPEETSQDPNATCPVCQMKMEARKK